MASTRIYRTAGSPTLNTKHTISMWFKRTKITYGDCFLMDGYQDASNRFKLAFDSSDRLELYNTHGGSYKYNVRTNRVFRDTAAFYHLVVRIDTTQASASDRVRVYVNGTEEESFHTYTDATQDDANNVVNESGATISIGDYQGGGNAFEGLMAHVHFVDGTSYAPTTFGETDSTSGIWKPKTVPSVTYGNNGFFLKFENSGNLDLDSSGNNLTFTTSGTLTQNIDTPSNVYTTWNNLASRETATNGGTQIHPSGDASYTYATSTLGASKGKWYFEFESNGGNGRALIGMVKSDYSPEQVGDNEEPGGNAHSFAYRQNQGDIQLNNSTSSYGTQITWGTSGNVLMMAVDLDNNKVWYGIDGTWQNSGDPSNGTNGFDWSAVRTADEPYLCLAGDDTSSGYGNIQANFGSGFFGTTAVASANSDANGHGLFEYTVPTGFYTLNTKNIKEFG